MNSFRYFFFGLFATFLLPWYFMVVRPYQFFSNLEPAAYDEEKDGGKTGVFPAGKPGIVAAGREVYKNEGCVNCHTQAIRPDYNGQDVYKIAFGKGPVNRDPMQLTRETLPHDFLGDDFALIGQVRNGPDLSNVGYRHTDAAWHHRHLFDPRSIHDWSSMPSFRHLYQRRLVQGQASEDAVMVVPGEDPGEWYEIVPTYEAVALVGYLMSLKLEDEAQLPFAITGVDQSEGEPAPAPTSG
jgi:cytochrome c oxidase cbb3-type subunit 2